MVAEQKSKSKFRESLDRNKPSKSASPFPSLQTVQPLNCPPVEENPGSPASRLHLAGPRLCEAPGQEHSPGAARLVPGLHVVLRGASSPHSWLDSQIHSPHGFSTLAVVLDPF